jgi:hypothetical protein
MSGPARNTLWVGEVLYQLPHAIRFGYPIARWVISADFATREQAREWKKGPYPVCARKQVWYRKRIVRFVRERDA